MDTSKTAAERAQAAAQALCNAVNEMGFDHDAFSEAMMYQHRTLQQNAFRAMFACITKWGARYDADNYDMRNEHTCKTSAQIVELFPDAKYVPLV